jgi:hypothetical protein
MLGIEGDSHRTSSRVLRGESVSFGERRSIGHGIGKPNVHVLVVTWILQQRTDEVIE